MNRTIGNLWRCLFGILLLGGSIFAQIDDGGALEYGELSTIQHLDWIESRQSELISELNKTVVGQLKMPNGQVVSQAKILASIKETLAVLPESKKTIQKAAERVKSGTLSLKAFLRQCEGVVFEGLELHWTGVLAAAKAKLQVLQQKDAERKRVLAGVLQSGRARVEVADEEKGWVDLLESEFKEIAIFVGKEQERLIAALEVWGEENEEMQDLYKNWAADQLSIGADAGGKKSTFQRYMDGNSWIRSPIAMNDPVVLKLDTFMEKLSPADFDRPESELPPYPVRLVLQNQEVYGVETLGPAVNPDFVAGPDYWEKQDLGLDSSLDLRMDDVLIMVYGKNFSKWLGRVDKFDNSNTDGIVYSVLSYEELARPSSGYAKLIGHLNKRIAVRESELKKVFDRKGMEVIVVRATISVGTYSGNHSFNLGSVLPMQWFLRRGMNDGAVALFRVGEGRSEERRYDLNTPQRWAFEGDYMVARVRSLNTAIPPKDVKIRLFRLRGKELSAIAIKGETLIGVARSNTNDFKWSKDIRETYRSAYTTTPFRIKLGESDSPDDDIIHCREGDVIIPQLAYPGAVQQIEQIYSATFLLGPQKLGRNFTTALIESANKRGLLTAFPPEGDPRRDQIITTLANTEVMEVSDGSFFVSGGNETDKGTAHADETIRLGDLAILELLREEMLKQSSPVYAQFMADLKIVKESRTYRSADPTPYMALDRLYKLVARSGHGELMSKFREAGYVSVRDMMFKLKWEPGSEIPAQARMALQRLEYDLHFAGVAMDEYQKELTAYDIADDDDVEQLFRRVAPGAHLWVDELGSRFVQQSFSAKRDDRWWVQDKLAASYLISVSGKAATLAAKRSEGDASDQVALLGAALFTAGAPLVVSVEGTFGAISSVVTIATSLDVLRDVYEWSVRGEEEDYSKAMSLLLGGYYLGPKQKSEAKLHKSGWAVLSNVVFTGMGAAGTAISFPKQLQQARSAGQPLSPAQLVAKMENYRSHIGGDLDELIRLVETNAIISAAGTAAEQRIGMRALEQMVERLAVADGYELSRIVNSLTDDVCEFYAGARSSYTSIGMPARAEDEMRSLLSRALLKNSDKYTDAAAQTLADILEKAARGETPVVQKLGRNIENTLEDLEFLPKPNTNWRGYSAQRFLGNGTYCMVYEMGDDLVLKVGMLAQGDNAAVYLRTLEGADILRDAGIPQLKIEASLSKNFDDTFAIVQERLPSEAITLRGKRPIIHVDLETADLAARRVQRVNGIDYQHLFKQQGIKNPVGGLDAFKGKPMPSEFGEAICKLYRDMAQKGVIWRDGHLGNIAFIKEGDSWVAKVIDSDFVWKWSDNFMQVGERGRSAGESLQDFYQGIGGFEDPFNYLQRMQSLGGSKLSEASLLKLRAGQHLFDSPEIFMLKMLEFHKYIRYDRNLGKWVSGSMDIEDVRKVFEAFESRSGIDLKLGWHEPFRSRLYELDRDERKVA